MKENRKWKMKRKAGEEQRKINGSSVDKKGDRRKEEEKEGEKEQPIEGERKKEQEKKREIFPVFQ